jgi:hypothetical protein
VKISQEKPRDFYKSVKAMRLRDESFNPLNIISDKDGIPIFNANRRKERWREYFYKLLNPVQTILTGRTPQLIFSWSQRGLKN